MTIYKYGSRFKDTRELREWEKWELKLHVDNTEESQRLLYRGRYREALNYAREEAGLHNIPSYIYRELIQEFKEDEELQETIRKTREEKEKAREEERARKREEKEKEKQEEREKQEEKVTVDCYGYIEYNDIYGEKEAEVIPYDRNGHHATGIKCLLEDGNWWYQYLNEKEGHYEYYK